ncbi:hypothetical protein N3K66_001788 [Trichothecium roseum]|uniref:Uncharacterized protein n=1 Tax=Trichothecium roseum TaxID=47278 RepID=A0ACC0V971_9HYPO|nr:hypothetical protein N3K66_001788 [Trichothecium roseum]
MVSTRSSSRMDSPAPSSARASPKPSPRGNNAVSKRAGTASVSNSSRSSSSSAFSHAPTTLTLVWLAVSLPLVIWDTVYVLGRPATMPGGSLHWPLWVPYKLYGEVDYVYGLPALEAKSGFTAAQGSLNVVETLMYVAYLAAWLGTGRAAATGSKGKGSGGRRKVLAGRRGAAALLVGFSAAVMTLSKTVLYWAHEYFSEFANIGHNAPFDLLLLWIIPNGAWLVGSAYMICSMGGEILDGLAGSGKQRAKKD